MAEHGAHNLSCTALYPSLGKPHTPYIAWVGFFTAHHCTAVLSFSQQIICPGHKKLAAEYGGREGRGEVREKIKKKLQKLGDAQMGEGT